MTAVGPMPRWLVPSAVAAIVAPLAIAIVAQRRAEWHPVFDLAMTELRVRDVGGRHTPLIGLQGRIGPTGSHPGPLSFYGLAPVYRLFGSSSFALQIATAVFHAVGALIAVLVSARRRDPRLVVAVSVLVLLLMRGYGLGTLTEPWNPYLPVLWFVAFLVSIWAVVDGDLPMLLPAVAAGSVCAQTHVPYLPVTLGLGAVAGVVAVVVASRHRGAGRARWRWIAAAGALGVVLWIPPLIDEVTREPGNLTQLIDNLGTPADEPIGPRAAGRLVLERLDAWQLVVVEARHPGTYVDVLGGPGPTDERGLATLAVWLGCAGVSLRMRHRRLLALHGVVGVSVLVAVVAIARIYGVPWYYLMLWVFAIGGLMLIAIVATLAVLLVRWRPALHQPRRLLLVGTVLVAALAGQLAVLAPDATTGTPTTTAQLGRLLPDTAAALERGVGAATGFSGRYLVRWDDATNGGAAGLGLVNELVRRGYDVGVEANERVRVPAWRVRPPEEVTARVVLASGVWIDRWAAQPGARMIAMDDPRTADERREFADVRAAAIEALVANGREDLIERLDTDLFSVALNERIDGGVHLLLGRMLQIGVAVAVFVLPPGGSA